MKKVISLSFDLSEAKRYNYYIIINYEYSSCIKKRNTSIFGYKKTPAFKRGLLKRN